MSERRLAKQRIESPQPRGGRSFESDGLRLHLAVHPGGAKTWLSRVRWQGRDFWTSVSASGLKLDLKKPAAGTRKTVASPARAGITGTLRKCGTGISGPIG